MVIMALKFAKLINDAADIADELGQMTPAIQNERFRIEMTTGCRDCDGIPKVKDAGQVHVENGRRIQVMHNGVRVLADGYYGKWMTEVISRLRGHHEPQEESVFHEILGHLPKKATMLELGGFWSYYSLWFLIDQPEPRRSFVIEPDPGHIEIGRVNAALNGCVIEFVQGSVGRISTPPKEFDSETMGAILVPQIAVPDFLQNQGIDIVDLLHCDAQGAELDVIRSCEDLFRNRRIRFCVFSTHFRRISGDHLTHQRCLVLLKEYGGVILAEHDVHESFSGDGLIAAYFGAEPVKWTAPRLSYNRYSTSLTRNPLYDLDEASSSINALKQIARNLGIAKILRRFLRMAGL